MPKYLVEGRYTSDGLTGLAREGVSRRRADIAKMIESAGGKLEAVYFAFGDADFYIILTFRTIFPLLPSQWSRTKVAL